MYDDCINNEDDFNSLNDFKFIFCFEIIFIKSCNQNKKYNLIKFKS